MPSHPRALGLLAQVTRGLLRHGQTRTIQTLGDRSSYIGLSDVGRAITCLRAGHSITVRVELDTGAVTQQVLLSPGVNRAVIHVPTTGEIHEGTID